MTATAPDPARPTRPPLPSKVTDGHLTRLAVVYVRQSTPQQVAENRESLARQYALAGHAQAIGWPADRVLVIDDDLGLRGRTADGRPGFQRLLAEVTMDHVGLILGLEMSRLVRSCKDWYQLLEVCALFGTLLADQDGLYDPSDPNDRLLFGLKGQISELELHTIRSRLDRGRLNKARRGELFLHAPIGYVKTAAGVLDLDPDEQARAAVRLVFEKFDEVGTAKALVRYLRQHLVRLPVRPLAGPNRGQLEWRPPRLSTVFRILRNPVYAGTYAFGQRPVDPRRRRRDGQTPAVRVAPPDQWLVTLHGRVPAYITWDRYLSNGGRLRQNRFTPATPGHARKGVALLSGLVACGQRMHAQYGRRTCPRYECVAHQRRGEPRACKGLAAAPLDAVVAEQVLGVLTPSGIELSLRAARDIERERDRLDAHWRAEAERCAYEARLAERSYRAVDPDNRLVARTLERQWEQSLRREREVREGHDRFRRECPLELTADELRRVRSLAADVPALWHAADTPAADRKEIVRTLVERVTVTIRGATEHARVRIDWAGGSSSEHPLRRPVSRYEQLADFPALRDRVRGLVADGRTAAEVAERLNQEGWRPPSGRAAEFDRALAGELVYRLGLSRPRPPSVSLSAGEWWARDLAAELGVSLTRLRHWVGAGYVHARKVRPGGRHLVVWADADERGRLRRLRDDPRCPLPAGTGDAQGETTRTARPLLRGPGSWPSRRRHVGGPRDGNDGRGDDALGPVVRSERGPPASHVGAGRAIRQGMTREESPMRPKGSPAELERRRLRAVELMGRGEPPAVIARVLGVSRTSLCRWNKLAGRGALAAKPNPGRAPKLTDQQCQELERLLLQGATRHGWANELWTGARVRDVIRKHFGVEYHPGYVCGLLKRRLRWTSQIPEHRRRDVDEAETERWTTEEFPRVAREAAARGAYLAFVDETGFMLEPVVRRTYAPRGKTPVHKVSDIHARISVIGAITVSPRRDTVGMEYHLLPDNTNFCGASVARFVGALRTTLAGPMTLVWDQACIHDCEPVDRYLAAEPDVVAEPLPTYAPTLNPADGIWRYVKYGRLPNYAPPDLDTLRATVRSELDRLRGLPDLLKSFIRFTKLPLDL